MKANEGIFKEHYEAINKVMEFGAMKHGEGTWQYNSIILHLNKTLRHISKIMAGEYIDRESGFSHFAHIGCNIALAENIFSKINNKKNREKDE